MKHKKYSYIYLLTLPVKHMPPLHTNSKYGKLVFGKSEIALMKKKLTALPRLELQAVLLALRLKLTVTQEMDIHTDNIY